MHACTESFLQICLELSHSLFKGVECYVTHLMFNMNLFIFIFQKGILFLYKIVWSIYSLMLILLYFEVISISFQNITMLDLGFTDNFNSSVLQLCGLIFLLYPFHDNWTFGFLHYKCIFLECLLMETIYDLCGWWLCFSSNLILSFL